MTMASPSFTLVLQQARLVLFQDDDVKKFKFLGNFRRSYNNHNFQSYCGIGNSLELAILCMTLLCGNEPRLCVVSIFQQKSPFLSHTMSIIQLLGGNFPKKTVQFVNCSNKFIKPSSSHPTAAKPHDENFQCSEQENYKLITKDERVVKANNWLKL